MANATAHMTGKAQEGFEIEPNPNDVHAVEPVAGDHQLHAPLCTGNPDHMQLSFHRVRTTGKRATDPDQITCKRCRTKAHMLSRKARRELRRR